MKCVQQLGHVIMNGNFLYLKKWKKIFKIMELKKEYVIFILYIDL